MAKFGEKYGTDKLRKPSQFTAQYYTAMGCEECEEDILEGDICAYYDDQLMHADCALRCWELDQ